MVLTRAGFLHDTNPDDSGAATGQGVQDSHCHRVFEADPTVSLPTVTGLNPRDLSETAISNWALPTSNAFNLDRVGTDTWTTTSTLPAGIDPDTLAVTGRWSTDNEGVDILVNGVSTHQAILDTLSYQGWTGFQLTGGWQSGENTISLVVHNHPNGGLPNPAGLRVESTGIDLHPA